MANISKLKVGKKKKKLLQIKKDRQISLKTKPKIEANNSQKPKYS